MSYMSEKSIDEQNKIHEESMKAMIKLVNEKTRLVEKRIFFCNDCPHQGQCDHKTAFYEHIPESCPLPRRDMELRQDADNKHPYIARSPMPMRIGRKSGHYGMIEKKLRVWLIKEKEMRSWDSILCWRNAIDIFIRKDTIPMYYIGLKDTKNSREIYEGDIVVFEYDIGDGVDPRGKRYERKVASMESNAFFEFLEWHERSDSSEVIGNIFKNPEMLDIDTEG